MKGKLVLSCYSVKKGPKGITDAFHGSKKFEKTFWFCE